VNLTLAALAALLGLAAAAGDPRSSPAFEREIVATGGGLLALTLDRHVYEGARPDLGDLRLADEEGREVPFALDRGGPPGTTVEREPRMRNAGRTKEGAATAVLDFAERVSKSRLGLSLSGANFRRRVAVEGSDDGRTWTTLVDDGWLFAIPAPEPARYETVPLPENDFPLLRVTVYPGPGEREPVAIRRAWVPAGEHPPRRETVLEPRWSRAEDPRSGETWLTLDLGARHQPFHAVALEVENARFFREARVEARREPLSTGGPSSALAWAEVGRGVVYRLEHDGQTRECLRIRAVGRERVLRLRIRNRDDQPLRIAGVHVVVPVERMLFEAASGSRYRLTYGAPALTAPTYDLTRTLGVEEGPPSRAELGPPVRRAVPAEPPPPWSERYPALLWGGLLAVVAGLGAITWRALRSV
jgi:Protein of unknown function (DUF3999)